MPDHPSVLRNILFHSLDQKHPDSETVAFSPDMTEPPTGIHARRRSVVSRPGL